MLPLSICYEKRGQSKSFKGQILEFSFSTHRCFEARFVDEVKDREETLPDEKLTENRAVIGMYHELKSLAMNAVDAFVTRS